MDRKGVLVVISGFAGGGKGTLVKSLMEKYDNYALSVSMTTRAPRAGEQEGVSYFFVSREKFEQTIKEDGLIEYAEYVGNYYGTPKSYVEEQLSKGKDVILEIEIQGALQIRKLFPTALLIFVTPPSAEELKNRLIGRGTETPEVVKKRMDRAAQEADGMGEYDYILVNDTVEKAISDAHAIITAAHARPSRNAELMKSINDALDKMAAEN
jgi:guanylate kinase